MIYNKIQNLLNEKFYKGISLKDFHFSGFPDYVEVFKNPSQDEIDTLLQINSHHKYIRFFIDSNNDLYAFDGDVLHQAVLSSPSIKDLKAKYRLSYSHPDLLTMSEGTKRDWSKTFPKEAIDKIKYCLPKIKVLTSIFRLKNGRDEELKI